MSDLIPQLRQVEDAHRAFSLCYEAADEIERLRLALRQIAETFGPNHGSNYCKKIADAALANQPNTGS